ncbi:MAG: chemotaxis protein CheA [Spirochaetes bacterium]|nr:chemotaxis protein CheA [Spirochaetota bacterium]
MSDFIDEELLKDYFEEAYMQIEQIESNLLVLEKNTDDKDAIDAIFRAAHTLKGGSATVNMDEIAKFTHTLEDAMDEVRAGKYSVNPKIVDVLLDSLDIIKNMIEARSQQEIYNEDISQTVNTLKTLGGLAGVEIQPEPETAVESKPSTEAPPVQEASQAPAEQKTAADAKEDAIQAGLSELNLGEYEILEINEANTGNLPIKVLIVEFDETNPMRTVGGIQVFTTLRDEGNILKTIPDFDELYSEEFYKEVVYILATETGDDKLKEDALVSDCTKNVTIKTLEAITQGEQPKDTVPEVSEKTASETSEKGKPEEVDIDALAKSITNEAVSAGTNEGIDLSEIQQAIERQQQGGEKSAEQTVKPEQKAAPPRKAAKKEQQKIVTSSVLRVDSSRIDDLLNLVSEIVINKATFNQISNNFFENFDDLNFIVSDFKDKLKLFMEKINNLKGQVKDDVLFNKIKSEIQSELSAITPQFDSFTSNYRTTIDRFRSTNQNLDRISSSLQEGVMRVRMVQIKQIFSRFPRLVRDLCRDLKKEVELVIEGEETEVDKAMIDDLIDPLIHIVRNAVDHGFELPDERKKNGKKPAGTLKLQALNEGNLISIYISDDGKGIDAERIRKKAIDRGVITADKVMRQQDVYNLIFEPGFSTAEKITSVSGRGVGLDVVKKNIEKLSGSVRVTSELGKGSVFAIKLPLTLAIIQGLMIRVQNEIYALPISSVMDSLRISPSEIKSIDNYEVINVRDDVLSLLRLNRLFKLGEEEEKKHYFVVIVGSGDKRIGMLVDSLIGEEDIVIKPLKDKYTNTPGIAGATIYDGSVSLILDVSQLIELGLKQEMDAKAEKDKEKGRN